MMKEDCVKDDYLGVSYDPRYTASGLNANLLEMQTNYGVFSILTNMPSFADYVNENDAINWIF